MILLMITHLATASPPESKKQPTPDAKKPGHRKAAKAQASADETKAVTGQLIGGVTVFALPDSIPLYVDARIMDAEYVIVGGGNRSTKIRLSPRELERIPGVVVAPIALERI